MNFKKVYINYICSDRDLLQQRRVWGHMPVSQNNKGDLKQFYNNYCPNGLASLTANQISNTNWWHALLFTKEFEIYILAKERLKSQQV